MPQLLNIHLTDKTYDRLSKVTQKNPDVGTSEQVEMMIVAGLNALGDNTKKAAPAKTKKKKVG